MQLWSAGISGGQAHVQGATPIRTSGTAGTPRPWANRSTVQATQEHARAFARAGRIVGGFRAQRSLPLAARELPRRAPRSQYRTYSDSPCGLVEASSHSPIYYERVVGIGLPRWSIRSICLVAPRRPSIALTAREQLQVRTCTTRFDDRVLLVRFP